MPGTFEIIFFCFQSAYGYSKCVHLPVYSASSNEIVLGGENCNWKMRLFVGRERYKAGFFTLKVLVWLLLLYIGLRLLLYLHMYLLRG